jgi:hypothetical protein
VQVCILLAKKTVAAIQIANRKRISLLLLPKLFIALIIHLRNRVLHSHKAFIGHFHGQVSFQFASQLTACKCSFTTFTPAF